MHPNNSRARYTYYSLGWVIQGFHTHMCKRRRDFSSSLNVRHKSLSPDLRYALASLEAAATENKARAMIETLLNYIIKEKPRIAGTCYAGVVTTLRRLFKIACL